jgi:hypothetical protein
VTNVKKSFRSDSSYKNTTANRAAFEITTYKAQGLTMNKIVVDLQIPPGTLQVASRYLPLSRVKRGEDLTILRPFDIKVLQIRPSLAQDAELKRLDEL